MTKHIATSLRWLAVAGIVTLSACGGGSGSGSSGSDREATQALGDEAENWTRCAIEGEVCSLTGTQRVRYGLDGRYAYKDATDSVACNNEEFGDPYPGADKFCEVLAGQEAPPASSETTWSACGVEDGICSFNGTRTVRYGLDGRYAYKQATDAISCNNTEFGDPYPGANKICEVASAGTTPPTPDAAGPYGQNAADYVLTFSEEFDGNTIDRGKWVDHLTWYLPPDSTPNWRVSDGSLKLFPVAGTDFTKRDYRHFTTDGHFEQTYGSFEMEAKLPRGNAVRPAFWLYNYRSPDPAVRPEIDIMETYPGGGPDLGWGDSDLHAVTFAATAHRGDGRMIGTRMFATGQDLSTEFHKYAVKWDPNSITFYFDGQPFHTIHAGMSDPMFILLSLQMCGEGQKGWCPVPDGTTVTGIDNSFEVRYVRAGQFRKP